MNSPSNMSKVTQANQLANPFLSYFWAQVKESHISCK
jgi:hypothetical protein